MKKIGSKLFLSFLCMAILTLSVLWLVQAVIMKDTYMNRRVAAVEQAVRNAAQAGSTDYDTLRESLNINLLVLNADGSARTVTQGMPMMGMVLRNAQSMIASQMDGTVKLMETSVGAARVAMLGHAIKGGGFLIAVFSLADVDAAATILRQQLWLITILLILSSIVLAVVLTRMFARPIRAVTGAARELAAGNLEISLPVSSQDEIGDLTVALNELSIQLHQTDNLRKELIANVSHELRAPLAVIQGYAETVRDVTWPQEEKRTRQLTMISEEASRLSRVVTDILDYSRLQAGVEKLSIVRFPLRPALEHAQQRYELDASRRKIRIEMQCPEHEILFDRGKFDQVMDNLLNNAVSHADSDSVILILATPGPEATRIAVQNAGPTIAPEEQERIWDRYHRVQVIGENQRLGTGLGLSIVKSILQRHGVSFGVFSEQGVTAFWFDTCAKID